MPITSGALFELGIALDGTAMAFTWEDATAIRSISTPCDGTPDSIRTAMAELAERAPAVKRAIVILRRPLAHMRTVTLERGTSRASAERTLSHDWARYVMTPRPQDHEVSARALPQGKWCAAFAPAAVLEALVRAGDELGWQEVVIGTADDALSTAVLAQVPVRKMTSFVAVVCSDTAVTDAVLVRGGAPVLGRRFLENATAEEFVAFMESGNAEFPDPGGSERAVVLGAGRYGRELTRALGGQGIPAHMVSILPPHGAMRSSDSALDVMAAAGRLRGVRLPLISGNMRAQMAKTMRPVTYGLAVLLAAAIIAAVVLSRWGMHRTLGDLGALRADLASQVRSATDMQVQVNQAGALSATLVEREQDASRIAAAIAGVIMAVPATTPFQSLSIAGDSVVIEGDDPQLDNVVGALRNVPALERIAFAAPGAAVRPDGAPGGGRFIVSARIRGLAAGRAE